MSLEFRAKSRRKLRFSQRRREVIAEPEGRVGESPEARLLFLGGYSFNLRLEYEGETEKIIEEIVLGHGEEPAVEDICRAVPLKHLYASERMWGRVQLT